MLGGVTGPYLAYLKFKPAANREATLERVIGGFIASSFYLFLILTSVSVAKKFGKTPGGIMLTNCLVFVSIILVSFGIVHLFE